MRRPENFYIYEEKKEIGNKNIHKENETPGNNISINFKGTEFNTTEDEIQILINNTMTQYFQLENFSTYYNTEKAIFDYFYPREKKCLFFIKNNFGTNKIKQKYFKSLILYVFITSKYESIKEISQLRKRIQTKLEIISEEIKKGKILNKIQLEEKYYQEFKTKNVPKFLIHNQMKKVKNFQFKQFIDKKFDEVFNKNQFLITIYYQIVDKKCKPFQFCNIQNFLYKILYLSNYCKGNIENQINNLLLENNEIIDETFFYNFKKKEDFNKRNNFLHRSYLNDFMFFSEEEIRNKIKCCFIEINKEINQRGNENEIYFIIASYFYLLMVKMKDFNPNNNQSYNKLNINNPIFNKIIKNIIDCFNKNLNQIKVNLNTLLKMLYSQIIVTQSGYIDNQKFDFNKIKNILYFSKAPDLFKEELNLNEKNIIDINLKKFLPSRICDKYLNLLKNHKNISSNDVNISLFPLINRIYSNEITIFISGFLSEQDNFEKEWIEYIDFESKYNNFYFYRWPSDNYLSLSFDFPWIFSFQNCTKKAKSAGIILAITLLNDKFFENFKINLVGFSLGCHVLKHCIKHLELLNVNHKVRINNAVFLGGATAFKRKEKWINIFNNVVKGKVINCYSSYDQVLGILYRINMKKEPIGRNKISFGNINMSHKIKNFDLSDLKLKHTEYRAKFNLILERIGEY